MATRDNDLSILVHAPTGRDGPATANLLQQVGLSAQVCPTFASLMNALAEGAGAVFVAEEGLIKKDLSDLAGWVARQPPWSDLPFFVLATRHVGRDVAKWRQQLVKLLRNVSLIERPIHAITLTSTMQAAIRARTRQYEVRALIDAQTRAAAELEAQVEERTNELEHANWELRNHIAERTRVEETLRQAQKMEAIGQLTGGIAHDFNNLLMVITSGLDLLSRHDHDPERRQRLRERMRQAASRGAALTTQLLAFSRPQALKREAVDLARHIGRMRELLDRSLRGDVHIQLEFSETLWCIEVDPGELELAVLNLAVNARDAMPAGGTIIVRGENRPADGQHGEDQVCLSVIDSGTGMPAEVRMRAFEPFFTTKEVGKGSGLGLAQVYGFARQSGGSVLISSEPGEGTTVSMLLPRSLKIPAERNKAPQSMNEKAELARTGSVLLVEDDDQVAALVSDMLREIGYDITRAASAASALGALANGRDIDIVFSDVMMAGGMDGVGLAKEIRARRPGLPILLTSGYAERARKAAEGEGIPLLAKPYAIEDLARALEAARQGQQC